MAYKYFRTITIDNTKIAANETNYPVLINEPAVLESGRQTYAFNARMNTMCRYGDKTFIVYLDSSYGVRVVEYDTSTERSIETVLVASQGSNDHYAPSICVDTNGYLHVFYGAHGGSALQWMKSSNSADSTEWGSASAIVAGAGNPAYPQPVVDKAGKIWLFYRELADIEYRTLALGGGSWSGATELIDGESYVVNPQDVCISNHASGSQQIHLLADWYDTGDQIHDDPSYARYDISTATWEKSDGTDYTLPIQRADIEKIAGNSNFAQGICVDPDNHPHVVYRDITNSYLHHGHVEAGSWTDDAVDGTNDYDHWFAQIIYRAGGLEIYAIENLANNEVRKHRSTNEGDDWTKTNITSGSSNNQQAICIGGDQPYTHPDPYLAWVDDTAEPCRIYTYPTTIGTTAFATTANGGYINNTVATGGASGALTVPADLVFSPNKDGSSKYSFEIEKYSATTGELVAWVKIPSLSSGSDTVFYVAYGDSGVVASQEDITGTWDTKYKLVNNMMGASATACKDSTSNNNDPTGDTGGPHSYQESDKFGYAVDLADANQSSINIPDADTLDFGSATDFTLEAVVSVGALASGEALPIIYKRYGGGDASAIFYSLFVYDPDGNGGHINGNIDDDVTPVAIIGTAIVDDGDTHYIICTFDRDGNGQVYLDGSTDGSSVSISDVGDIDNDNQFDIGRSVGGDVGGVITMIRVRADLMDADEITTTYNNLFSYNDFYEMTEHVISGSAAWGHITGVVEDNVRTFLNNWTGTGDIERSHDDEQLATSSGEYMESEIVETGAGLYEIDQNYYKAGDNVTLKYKHGATQAACDAAEFGAYSAPFDSLGFVQIRVESAL